MSFCFHEGKGYVAEDGCHRACIAKFFLYSQPSPFLRGVHFTEVQTDARMTNLFYRLKKLLPVWYAAFPNSQEVTRNDDAKGWSMSFYGNVSQPFELRGVHDPTSLHCRKTVTRQSHCR